MVCAEGNAGECKRKGEDDDDCEGGEDDDVTRKALLFELWLRGQRCALLLYHLHLLYLFITYMNCTLLVKFIATKGTEVCFAHALPWIVWMVHFGTFAHFAMNGKHGTYLHFYDMQWWKGLCFKLQLT